MTTKTTTRAWKWAPGMLALEVEPDGTIHPECDRVRVLWVRDQQVVGVLETRSQMRGRWDVEDDTWVDVRSGGEVSMAPARDDPATLGALLGQVRERLGHVDVVFHPDIAEAPGCPRFVVRDRRRLFSADPPHGTGPTEWDALVAALQAAP